jgi:hypothetical protein
MKECVVQCRVQKGMAAEMNFSTAAGDTLVCQMNERTNGDGQLLVVSQLPHVSSLCHAFYVIVFFLISFLFFFFFLHLLFVCLTYL